MRRLLVSFSVLAFVAPAAAQEKMPAPATAPVVTQVSPTPAKPGLLSRIFRGRDANTVEINNPMAATPSVVANRTVSTITTTTNGVITTTNREPMYDRRGRMIGYRAMTPATTTAAQPAVMPMPTPKSNPVPPTGQAAKVTDSQVVQASAVEPAPEPKRGLFYRLGLKK